MGRVTAIRAGKGQRKRVNVFLDGRFAFSLEAEAAAKENLWVGQELSEGEIEALARSDGFHRCLNAAARYLSYRPRSEAELRERLLRRGYDSGSVEAAIAKLREQGLVDDVVFAQFWRDSRQSFNPRSRWLTGRELRQKGVAEDIINQVTSAVDDDESAYQAAVEKRHRLSQTDYQSFRHRLGTYLKRRGFSYGIINRTVSRIWQQEENVG